MNRPTAEQTRELWGGAKAVILREVVAFCLVAHVVQKVI